MAISGVDKVSGPWAVASATGHHGAQWALGGGISPAQRAFAGAPCPAPRNRRGGSQAAVARCADASKTTEGKPVQATSLILGGGVTGLAAGIASGLPVSEAV